VDNTATAWSALGTAKAKGERLSLGHDVAAAQAAQQRKDSAE